MAERWDGANFTSESGQWYPLMDGIGHYIGDDVRTISFLTFHPPRHTNLTIEV